MMRVHKKEARLVIVGQLFKKGWSYRQIREEVMRRLDLTAYSIGTVHNDVKTLLNEWRQSRMESMDDALQLELERIDSTVRELWEQWEKSKEDYTKTVSTQKGIPSANGDGEGGNANGGIITVSAQIKTANVVGLGDPRYIAEIRAQLAERRKLLGLYAPEKKDIQGSLSFAQLLMDSGIVDEEENAMN